MPPTAEAPLSSQEDLDGKRLASVHRIYEKLDQIEETVTDTREMVIAMRAGDYGRRLDEHAKDIRTVRDDATNYKLATNARLDRMETRIYIIPGVIAFFITAIGIVLQVLKMVLG